MAIKIPPRLIVSGVMVTSEVAGNGVFFHPEHLAELVGKIPGNPFVANHDRGIAARAGTMKEASAERFDQTFDTFAPDPESKSGLKKTGTTTETGTRLHYKAELSNDFPAYDAVAQSILAIRKNGGIPNVSVAVAGKAIGFDHQTQRFMFLGPYRFLHLGHVDTGAFGPDVGVGVDNVSVKTDATFSFSEDQGTPEVLVGTTTFNMMNVDELVVRFIDEYGLDSPLVEKLGKTLGRDTKPKKTEIPTTLNVTLELDTDAAQTKVKTLSDAVNALRENIGGLFSLISKNPELEKNEISTSNAKEPQNLESLNSPILEQKDNHQEMAQVNPETVTDPAKALSALQAEVAALKLAQADAEARAFADAKSKLVQFGVEESALAAFTTLPQLVAAEKLLLNAKGSPLPRGSAPSPAAPPASYMETRAFEDEKTATVWHDKQIAKFQDGAN